MQLSKKHPYNYNQVWKVKCKNKIIQHPAENQMNVLSSWYQMRPYLTGNKLDMLGYALLSHLNFQNKIKTKSYIYIYDFYNKYNK